MGRVFGYMVLGMILGGAAVCVAPEGSSDAHAATASPLTRNAWVMATLAGKAPLRGTDVTAAFTPAGRVSGSTGCNRYTGTYTSSGSTLRISGVATTQMACSRAITLQERAFLKALSATRSFAVRRGTLTLRTAGGRPLATFRAQTQALAGTAWDVLSYNNGKQAVVSVLADTKLTAVFGRDGRLTGFAGCNNYNAGYKATPPKIEIGPVASTQKACDQPAGVNDQEARYLIALETAATYRIEGSRLELRTADGALAVDLRRR